MFLQLQGQEKSSVDALRRGELESATISSAESELLKFAELLTSQAHSVQRSDVQRLRDVGWTDPQIAEAVYITALFAFFNRVADAFGLELPPADLLGQLDEHP